MGHSGDASMRLQTLQPKFHLRIAAVFILAILFLGFLSFTKHGVYRAYYGGFACLAAVALIVQYCRERTIVHNRLSAVGVVTEYRIPLRRRTSLSRDFHPPYRVSSTLSLLSIKRSTKERLVGVHSGYTKGRR
jgi:hypothetical protein